MQGYVPMEEWKSLGHPFSNLNNYSIDIELKLTWKNKMESKKLNVKS